MAQQYILADGQLAAASAQILGVNSDTPGDGRYATVVFFNTSQSSAEALVLTVTRGTIGSSARRIPSPTLNAGESWVLMNLPLGPGDVLSGYTTDALTVDYTVFRSNGGQFGFAALDQYGMGKGVAVLRQVLAGIEELAGFETVDPGV